MKTQQQSLLSLFKVPNKVFGLSKAITEIRVLMNSVAKDYEPGRDLLVDAINDVAAREDVPLTNAGAKSITKSQLDKWLQPTAKSHAPNFNAVFCFCLATNSFEPLEPIFDALGLTVIRKEDLRFFKLGRATVNYKEAREELKNAEAYFK